MLIQTKRNCVIIGGTKVSKMLDYSTEYDGLIFFSVYKWSKILIVF